MKRKSLFFAMACLTVVFAGCKDESDHGKSTIYEGDEVKFGVSGLASFDKGYSDAPSTRTVYGEGKYVDGKWHYPLSWVYGDEISVYCPQSSGGEAFVHYAVKWNGGSEGDIENGTSVYMIKTGENGLRWGDTSQNHDFYAFYPSSAIRTDMRFADGLLHGNIPNTQDMVEWVSDGNGNWTGRPDMNYAFMRAYNRVTPDDARNDKVTLDFKPLTTAIEITLEAAGNMTSPVTISQIQILATNKDGTQKQAVCGDFEYDIVSGVNTLVNEDVVNDYMITVPCWHESGGVQVPIELASGKKLTFTVFLLPGTDGNGERTLRNLQVRVPGWNAGLQVKTYENINIAVGTKSQVWLPEYEPATGSSNNWLGSLPDNVYISQLSIPGSVNAFSGEFLNDARNYVEGASEMDQTQVMSVTDQLDFGVRALEIATERATGLYPNSYNLGTQGSLIAGTTTSSNLASALRTVAGWLKRNDSEFVIVMPYYAPNATDIPEAWSNQLKNYLQTVSDIDGVEILPFDNSMTIGDARGKILFLSRMPGSKADVDRWVGTPQKTTAIYGWDSDKNRWKRRGYDMSASGYWNGEQWNGKADPKGAGYTEPDYKSWKYDAVTPSSAPDFYIQDWFRVCNGSGRYRHTDLTSSTYWYESKSEKISHIKNFMDASVNVMKQDYTGGSVFINSLAGYYVVNKNWGVSAIPAPTGLHPDYGKHGDIPAFARDMNNVVYNYVLGLKYENRGPLGIMLINYTGMPEAFGMKMSGDYIVRALIDNNFRFPLFGMK